VDGSFNHTRCFIRDDTGRRVREARADAVLTEMERSLTLLDNFMSNTLHFVRTPCNVMMGALEEAGERLEAGAYTRPLFGSTWALSVG